VAALAALRQYTARPAFPRQPTFPDVDPEVARAIIGKARASGRTQLDELESAEVLAAYGIPMASGRAAATPVEAVQIAEELGLPVAVKVLSAEIGHKSELGGVRLGLNDAAGVESAALDVLAAASRAGVSGARILVQRMAGAGLEMALGMKNDAVFGAVVLVASGGVLIELLEDRALALAPLDGQAADRLISSLRGARLLAGYRGGPSLDRSALVEALSRLSALAADLADEVAEIDLNPVFVHERGVTAADALITLLDRE
jgi:acyl-CoA synthetase (NDP forming)